MLKVCDKIIFLEHYKMLLFLARTEVAKREDEVTEQAFKAKKARYYDWVTEPGA